MDASPKSVYVVMSAIYKDSHMLPQLINHLKNLEKPDDKYCNELLYVIVIEEKDKETTEAILKYKDLPENWHFVVVPQGVGPQTKPNALNAGWRYVNKTLGITKGYLTVFDAEDRPQSDQLKKAVLVLSSNKPSVAAVQARLVVTNDNGSVIDALFRGKIWAMLFSMAYELHFSLILPLLSEAGFVPLGGTSFHMPIHILNEIGGWDAWNPTEDLGLAVELSRKRYETLVLDSVTYEEAPTQFKNRLKQLTRWMKGYIITWMAFWKNPNCYMHEMGLRRTLVFMSVVGGGATLPVLNILVWLLTFVYFATRSAAIEALFPPVVYTIGMILMIFGNIGFLYSTLVALIKGNKPHLIKWAILFTVVHWIMLSIATVRAYMQIVMGAAHYWENTYHEPTVEETAELYVSRELTTFVDNMGK